MAKAVARVLIYRLGSLGDTVVALPALHVVSRALAGAERRLLTNVPVAGRAVPAAAVLDGSGLVQGYFSYAARTRNVAGLLGLWWQILSWRPEVLVHLGAARGVRAARRDAWFFRLCGVRRMVGVPVTEEMQAHLPVGEGGEQERECERLLRNIAELGEVDPLAREAWDLRLDEGERGKAGFALAGLPHRLIAVSVGTKMQAKDWGTDNWCGLMSRLAQRYPESGLVLVGSAEEREASARVAAAWGGAAVNLCGQLSVRESAAVLARVAAFAGHDSGPMHLAAAMGTPCVAVFSSRNLPRVWFPMGRAHRVLYHSVPCMGCRLETCVAEGKKCILSIAVEEVLQAVTETLGQGMV